MVGLDLRGTGQRGDRPRDARDAHASATRERQPVDGVREQLGRLVRATRQRRCEAARAAATTRSRTALERSPGAAASSAARGRGIATARSNRSRSARESFSRYAASRWALQPHSTAGSPRAPHGHMFIVPTSWNRAGKIACPPARATATTPSSSGCRSASRTERGNSGSSSSSSTPRCASETSPGRGVEPPPTIAGADVPWCGARNGGTVTSGRPWRKQAGHRVDPRHLERFLPRERREDPRKPPREHRLPRSGRAGEEDVVRPGRRDLERPPGTLLPAHVGEVGPLSLPRSSSESGSNPGASISPRR